MKIKDKKSDSTEKSAPLVKSNGSIEKKKQKPKKKKDNFEVRVPRIIVRNLNFKVTEEFFFPTKNRIRHFFLRSMKRN